ncbi:MAG: hypothetical protein GY718_14385 [Lentisphaerae bacterium]|nr:hypothetical protein [Lentisphaerota bacterium]
MEGMDGQVYATTPYVEEQQVHEEPQEYHQEETPYAEQEQPEEHSQEEQYAFEEVHEEPEQAFEEETHDPNLDTSDNKPAAGTTNTVKLSRSSIGMMPTIEDSFSFSTVEKAQTETAIPGEIETASDQLENFGKSQARPAKKAPSQKPKKKKWWEFLLFWKK